MESPRCRFLHCVMRSMMVQTNRRWHHLCCLGEQSIRNQIIDPNGGDAIIVQTVQYSSSPYIVVCYILWIAQTLAIVLCWWFRTAYRDRPTKWLICSKYCLAGAGLKQNHLSTQNACNQKRLAFIFKSIFWSIYFVLPYLFVAFSYPIDIQWVCSIYIYYDEEHQRPSAQC